MNWILPLCFHLNRRNSNYRISNDNSSKNKVIVSFTTFPKRIHKVWLVVETILRQTQKPDMVILWLSKDQFPTIDSVPSSLVKLQKRGLTIRYVDGDIRSHKKYYYVFKEYPNDIVVTVDDDIFYPSNMIKTLLESYKKNPKVISARYGYKKTYNSHGMLLPYKEWVKIYKEEPPSVFNFFGSGGGTLFPPNSLDNDVTNIRLAEKLCPYADDVYLNAMAFLNSTKVCFVDNSFVLLNIRIKNDIFLASTNLDNNQNDDQIKSLQDYYLVKRNLKVF